MQNWGGNDSTYGDGPAPQSGTAYPRYGSAPNTTNVTSLRYAAYTCPSDIKNSPIGGITNHNYAANWGNTHYGQGTYPNTSVNFLGAPFGQAKSTVAGQRMRGNEFAAITDGLSNTILVAEVLQGQKTDLRGFVWWGDASGFTTYELPNTTVPDRIYDAGYCNNEPLQNLPCAVSSADHPTRFASRSRHPGGVQVAMCDGSVKFITQTVDLNVWRGMGSSRGSETIQIP